MTDTSPTARFEATLHQADGMNATGIIVSPEIIEQLDAGQRPPVRVTLNGFEYRTTVAVMGGTFMIGVSAEIRKRAGLSTGDKVDVELVVDTSPREVDMPEDFSVALDAVPGAREFFDGLSNSLQRYHVDNINAAKTADTRQRRIDKATDLFRNGLKR